MKPLKYHHLGIPTGDRKEGEEYLSGFKLYVSGYETSEYGIEWMRYEPDCPLPDIVKTIPHVAFEVDDVYEAIKGKKILIEPNSPSAGVVVAFIEENGAPIEFIQINPRAEKASRISSVELLLQWLATVPVDILTYTFSKYISQISNCFSVPGRNRSVVLTHAEKCCYKINPRTT